MPSWLGLPAVDKDRHPRALSSCQWRQKKSSRRNKKLLFAVKTVYFFTPVVVGYGIMQMVIPDPEEMKKKMGPPSEYAAALTKHQKDGLREVLEQAQARQAQAQAQK